MTLKQVFVVNKDLKMRTGKVAVQVAHGETLYMNDIGTCRCFTTGIVEPAYNHKVDRMKENFNEWIKDGLMKKIVLKATKEEMLMIIGALKSMNDISADDIWFDIVFDKGLTQVPADSMTCIVFEPLDEKEANARFGYLKLL